MPLLKQINTPGLEAGVEARLQAALEEKLTTILTGLFGEGAVGASPKSSFDSYAGLHRFSKSSRYTTLASLVTSKLVDRLLAQGSVYPVDFSVLITMTVFLL